MRTRIAYLQEVVVAGGARMIGFIGLVTAAVGGSVAAFVGANPLQVVVIVAFVVVVAMLFEGGYARRRVWTEPSMLVQFSGALNLPLNMTPRAKNPENVLHIVILDALITNRGDRPIAVDFSIPVEPTEVWHSVISRAATAAYDVAGVTSTGHYTGPTNFTEMPVEVPPHSPRRVRLGFRYLPGQLAVIPANDGLPPGLDLDNVIVRIDELVTMSQYLLPICRVLEAPNPDIWSKLVQPLPLVATFHVGAAGGVPDTSLQI